MFYGVLSWERLCQQLKSEVGSILLVEGIACLSGGPAWPCAPGSQSGHTPHIYTGYGFILKEIQILCSPTHGRGKTSNTVSRYYNKYIEPVIPRNHSSN